MSICAVRQSWPLHLFLYESDPRYFLHATMKLGLPFVPFKGLTVSWHSEGVDQDDGCDETLDRITWDDHEQCFCAIITRSLNNDDGYSAQEAFDHAVEYYLERNWNVDGEYSRVKST